eukprot:scpid13834/ scgid5669/ 
MEGADDVLQSRFLEQQHLNNQLQQNYDELSMKLAAAELTIDRLRLGVNTRVHKTLIYELKEDEPKHVQHSLLPAERPYLDTEHPPTGVTSLTDANGHGPILEEDESPSPSPSRPLSVSHDRDASIADTVASSRSASLFSPGRPGSLDSQHLALILLCQSLQADIEALLHRLEQTPAHERQIDGPAVRTEFAGLQRRFGELDEGVQRMRQARHRQPLAVNASQPLEDELATVREMMSALEATLHPERHGAPRTQLSSTHSEPARFAAVAGDRSTTPMSAGSLADVPSIDECDDLSQYGMSMSQPDSPAYSPPPSSHDHPVQTPAHHDDVIVTRHDDFIADNSSPLSSSSQRSFAEPKPAFSASRRRAWQSSDSEGASAPSRSSHRRPPVLAVRSNSSVSSVRGAPLPSVTASEPPVATTTTTAVPTQTNYPSSANPSYASPYQAPTFTGGMARPYYPDSPAAAPAAAAVVLTSDASIEPPPPPTQHHVPWPQGATIATSTAPMTDGRHPVPAAGPGMQHHHHPIVQGMPHGNGNVAASPLRPNGHTRPAFVHVPAPEPDSGYTGSDMPVVSTRTRNGPQTHGVVRSSTGSELLPIASQSSAGSSEHQLSSSSSISLQSDASTAHPPPPRSVEHPVETLASATVSGTSSSPTSSTAAGTRSGSSVGLPASPSVNSAILSLRGDLARLRQQLLEGSSSPSATPVSTPVSTPVRSRNVPAAAAAAPASSTAPIRLPKSLSKSSEASEAALRNLLDNVTDPRPRSGTGKPYSSPSLSRRLLHDTPGTTSGLSIGFSTSGSSSTNADMPPPPQPAVYYTGNGTTQHDPGQSNLSTLSSSDPDPIPAVDPNQYRTKPYGYVSAPTPTHAHAAQPPPSQSPVLQHRQQLQQQQSSPSLRMASSRATQTPTRPVTATSVPDSLVQTSGRSSVQRRHPPPQSPRDVPPLPLVDAQVQTVRDTPTQTNFTQVMPSLDTSTQTSVTHDMSTRVPLSSNAQTPRRVPAHTPRSVQTQTPGEKSVTWQPQHHQHALPVGVANAGTQAMGYDSGLQFFSPAPRGYAPAEYGDGGVQTRDWSHSAGPVYRHCSVGRPAAATASTAHAVHPVMQHAASPAPPPPPPTQPQYVTPVPVYATFDSPVQTYRSTVPTSSSTPVRLVYPDTYTMPYLDELDLTEANLQATQLKRRSEGMARGLEDSLAYSLRSSRSPRI